MISGQFFEIIIAKIYRDIWENIGQYGGIVLTIEMFNDKKNELLIHFFCKRFVVYLYIYI